MRREHAKHARAARKRTTVGHQEARGLSPRAFPAKRRTISLLTARSEDLYFSIESVALDGGLAEGFDQVHELLCGGAVRRSGGGDNVLLDHHRAHVVRAEAER